MFQEKIIGFVGAGNMGSAMIGGLVRGGVLLPAQIIAADPSAERLAFLAGEFGIQTTADNQELAQKAHILVISVKPQVVKDVLPTDTAQQCDFILSIAAGVTIQQLVNQFGSNRVVRCMPNTPAMVGAGMSVWTATPDVSHAQRDQAAAILGALGEQLFVGKESLLDAATALSGSGPAYVFLVMEAMIDAGVHLGFSRAESEKLVLQTVKGAALYAEQSGAHVAVLRNQVTSPAGTTAEALYHMEQLGLRHALARGILAAYERSIALGVKKA